MERNKIFTLIFPYANTALKTEVVADSWLWHRRLEHLNFQSLKKLEQKKMVYGRPPIHELKEVCEGCALGKHNRGPFPKDQAWRAKAPLELVHTDVCGPMPEASLGGNKYFITFIDDYSRMTWMYFMKEKSDVFTIFKRFQQ